MLVFFCSYLQQVWNLTLLIVLQVTVILSFRSSTVSSRIQDQRQLMLLLVIGTGKTLGFVHQFTSCHRLLNMSKSVVQLAHWWSQNDLQPLCGQFYIPMQRIQGHLSQIQWSCTNRTYNTPSWKIRSLPV